VKRNFLPGFIRSYQKKKKYLQKVEVKNSILLRRVEKLDHEIAGLKSALRHEHDKFIQCLLYTPSVTVAAAGTIRDMLRSADNLSARTLAQSLRSDPQSREAGAVAMALYLHGQDLRSAALGYFEEVPASLLFHVCPTEYSDVLLSQPGTGSASAVVNAASDFIARNQLSEALGVIRSLMKHARVPDATELLSQFPPDDIISRILPENEYQEIAWAREVHANRLRPVGTLACAVVFGLMDYKLLARDRSSSNLGDYVQTLAAFGNIARHERANFHSENLELQTTCRLLQRGIPPSARSRCDNLVKVEITPVDRDYASGRSYLRPTWFISNGWFMHANGRGVFDFPYPENIRPIFVSFHINEVSMLDAAAIEYLRRYQPIGCRDWNTVYRLLNRGVDAFFSGCLTTTVGQIYERSGGEKNGCVANVEARLRPEDVEAHAVKDFTQLYDDVRALSLAEGMKAADGLLRGYRQFTKIITSRLHCYLPCRSLGLTTEFRPRRESDVRFDGLLDLSEDDFNTMRQKLEDKLSRVVSSILDRTPEEEVYGMWRDLCADEVSLAHSRLSAEFNTLPDVDIAGVVAQLNSSCVQFGPAAPNGVREIIFSTDEALFSQLPITVASLLANCVVPVRVNILCRGIDEAAQRRLAAQFSETAFRFYDFSSVEFSNAFLLKHTSVSTLDRLFIPEIIQSDKPVLYLDIDVMIRKDIASLLDFDLKDCVIGARATTSRDWLSGEKLLELKAKKHSAEKAERMRRWAYATGRVDFRAVNAGVLLIDTARLKADRFTANALAMIDAFGFHDQDAINFYCREKCALLDIQWNFVPSQDYCRDPAIVHWAGPAKPWGKHHVLFKEEYAEWRRRTL